MDRGESPTFTRMNVPLSYIRPTTERHYLSSAAKPREESRYYRTPDVDWKVKYAHRSEITASSLRCIIRGCPRTIDTYNLHPSESTNRTPPPSKLLFPSSGTELSACKTLGIVTFDHRGVYASIWSSNKFPTSQQRYFLKCGKDRNPRLAEKYQSIRPLDTRRKQANNPSLEERRED